MVRLHPHARKHMGERGATEEEVRAMVEWGRAIPGEVRRNGFSTKL